MISILSHLSKEECCALCYMAYHLEPVEQERLVRDMSKLLSSSRIAVDAVLGSLKEEGMIEKSSNHYYWGAPSFSISNKWVFPALCALVMEHPEWEEKILKLMGRRKVSHPTRDALLDLARSMHLGFSYDGKNPYLKTVCLFIAPWVKEPDAEQWLAKLPAAVLCEVLPSAIIDHINNDSGSGIERLMLLADGLPEEGASVRKLQHLMMLAYFMEQGRLPEGFVANDRNLPGDWFLPALRALEALHREQFSMAYTYFGQALKELGVAKNWSVYNTPLWFDLPLLNLLYVISMVKCGDSRAANRLNEISSASLYVSYSSEVLAQVFVCAVVKENSDAMTSVLAEAFKQAPKAGWVVQKMANMLSLWMGVSKEQLRRERRDILCDPAEISYFADATRLADGLLQSIRIKPLWEKAIERIISQEELLKAKKENRKIDENRTTRLAYFFQNGSSRIETREQKRLKNGSWSAGKRVSDSFFIYAKEEDLDDLDLKIRGLYNAHRYQDPPVREVLPYFVGTDKLFFGQRAPYQQCNVQEEKPFISTRISKDLICLTSNVPASELDNREENHLLFSLSQEGDLRYFRVPLRMRAYLKALLKVGQFPLEAEPQLRKLFDQLQDIIEIHSDMIEGGSTLPSIDGDTHIILQASSERGGNYRLQALVRPLPEGRETVLPGRGEASVFDQLPDGTRYQVVRNKKEEKHNLASLIDQMEQMECDEAKPCLWWLDAYQLLELMEWLPEQGDRFVMEWPEGDKIKLNVADTSKWNLSLKSHGGWFEIEGEVPIDEDTILSIGQLFDLLDQGHGRFIRLKEGQFLSLTDSLRRQLSRIESVAQSTRGKMRISPLAAGLIGDALSGEVDIDHPQKIDELRQRIRQSQQLQADVPASLNATLRDYQEEGFRWIDRLSSWGAGACLADDMGLGKTVQTIAFLLHKQAEGASLVVAPASVVPNWKKELARFAPSLQVVVINELASDDRKLAIAQAEAGCVVVSTYGLLMTEEEAVTAKQWNVICLDEAHSIKNASTKTSAVCMRLQGQHRLILTGTPIQNHLGELWNLFQFINPGLLGSQEQFTRKYIKPIEEAHDKERQKQLKRIVQPFMLRRTKQEVVAELPDKQEITLPVQLSAEEMAIYELIRMEAKQQLEDDSDSGVLSVNTLAMITQLRMAACSAMMVKKGWAGGTSKLDVFCDLVSEICTSGNRVLVFSQFTSFLEMAKNALERRGLTDYFYLDGSTPMKKRSEMVDAFQKGKCPLFIISLKAGGLGLNLTGANYVIHLDPWWNPAIEQQATDRAYRIGQEQKVTVYHLISEHTIEEKIVRLHQTKRDLADSLLEGTDLSHKLSAADLLEMIADK